MYIHIYLSIYVTGYLCDSDARSLAKHLGCDSLE